jgi:hypothetical protein
MTVNLMHANEAATADQAKKNWSEIKAVSTDGFVYIDENTVKKIAALVDGQMLNNGTVLEAYAYKDDDMYPAYVSAFGPSLLPTQVQDQIRDLLAAGKNGKEAVRLYNLIISLGLQISLQGEEFCGAHIQGVNWVADEVEVTRTSSNMTHMFASLGLSKWTKDNYSDNIPMDVFTKAVNDNASQTDMPELLKQFVDCAVRNNATHVYWA